MSILDTNKAEIDKKKRLRDKQLRDKELNDLRAVLALPEGRRLMWRVIARARTFQQSFVPGMPDVGNFNEGSRSIGSWLFDEILNAKPDAYQQMVREHKSEAVVKEQIEKNLEESNA